MRRVPDVTRLLDRMEETGLLARVRDGEDRRYVTARISPQGLALLERLDQEILRIHRSQLGHVDRQATEAAHRFADQRPGRRRAAENFFTHYTCLHICCAEHG